MAEKLKLLCVLAHPDDESLGCGGVIAWSVAHGAEAYLECATRGERGWTGREEDNPGLEALGRIREAELREAGQIVYSFVNAGRGVECDLFAGLH